MKNKEHEMKNEKGKKLAVLLHFAFCVKCF